LQHRESEHEGLWYPVEDRAERDREGRAGRLGAFGVLRSPLPYLQTHLTIGEIGERLFVSRNTVSSQVSSIYRKLGVSSRSDAVTQATAAGLLGG
jgi:Bacterial regulatory proteins, luxR family